LFLSRVGGVLVVDTSDMKPVGSIPAFAGTRVFGIALAPELGLGVLSAGSDKAATVFDLHSLEVTRRVQLAHASDDILLDTASGTAVAFGGDDPVAMAFDPATGGAIATIDLPGSPESPVSDGEGAIYVDLSDTGEIARINTKTWKVDAHWPIGGPCKEPTPMAIDRRLGRVFVGCRSGVLAIVDLANKALIATLPIGAGADTVVFDDRSGLIFVSCNDGTLSIFKATSAASFALVQTVPTAAGARTMALDPETLKVFLPVADRGPMLPKVGDIPSRPAIVPETFRILTVAR
jgi:DNA-binding beta-propeller fold protein YncE